MILGRGCRTEAKSLKSLLVDPSGVCQVEIDGKAVDLESLKSSLSQCDSGHVLLQVREMVTGC